MKAWLALARTGLFPARDSAMALYTFSKRRGDGRADAPRVWMEALEPRRMLSRAGAPATVDFGPEGGATIYFPSAPTIDVVDQNYHSPGAVPYAMANAPDGKLYIVGALESDLSSKAAWGLVRFNTDGRPDPTFGTDGSGTETISIGQNTLANRLLVQRDGKIIVVALAEKGIAVARFNIDGSLDRSFGGGVCVYDEFDPGTLLPANEAAWLTPEGKVMLLGTRDLGLHQIDGGLLYAEGRKTVVTMRLNTDGTPDETFAPGGSTAVTVAPTGSEGMLLDGGPLPGGGIVAYIVPPAASATALPVLKRVELDPFGRLVSIAKVPGPAGDWWDGSVTLAADGSAYAIAFRSDQIERIDPHGAPDETFGQHGLVELIAPPDVGFEIDGIIAAPNGKSFAIGFGGMVRLNADGSIDTSFANGELVEYPWPSSAFLARSDGSILLGDATPFDFGVLPGFDIVQMPADGGPDHFGQLMHSTADPVDSGAPAADPSNMMIPATAIKSDPPLNASDRSLFADVPGFSIWNPTGKRRAFDSEM